MRRPGCLAAVAATARSALTTVWSVLFWLPATVNVTRADRPSREIRPVPPGASGARTSAATPGIRRSAAATWAAACRSSRSFPTVRPGERDWMSTLSAGGWITPGRSRTRSAWPAWPGS